MAAHKKKVDVNSTSLESLVELPDIGPVLAGKIFAGRPYRRLTELRNIPGIGDKLYDELREYVRVARPAVSNDDAHARIQHRSIDGEPSRATPAEQPPHDDNAAAAPDTGSEPPPILQLRSGAAISFTPFAGRQAEPMELPVLDDEVESALEGFLVDINAADTEQLARLPGIGRLLAERIISERPYAKIADLGLVPGIGATLFARVLPLLQPIRTDALESRGPTPSSLEVAREGAPKPTLAGRSGLSASVDDDPVAAPEVVEWREVETESVQALGEGDENGGASGATPVAIQETRASVGRPSYTVLETEATVTVPESTASHAPRINVEGTSSSIGRVVRSSPDSLVSNSAPIHPLRHRRPPLSAWVFWVVGLVGIMIVAFAALTFARRDQPDEAAVAPLQTISPTQLSVESPPTEGAVAQPPTFVIEPSSEPATPLSLPAEEPQAASAKASATPALTQEPAATEAPALATAALMASGESFSIGNILWAEYFDPPTFNWGRGFTSIADATYIDGTLQASLLNRIEPFWSIGPTYRVGARDFLYEGDITVANCVERDFYGLVFRADGNDFYTFAITCDGQYRLLRRAGGQETILQFTSSPNVPSGPGTHRLGVLVLGKHIVVAVNGQAIHEQHEGRLDLIPAGDFGVFARMVSSSALSVRWDNLVAFAVTPASP